MPPEGGQGAKSAADCLYSPGFYLSALYRLCGRALPGPLGTEDLTRVPRIQMCCSTEGPPGGVPPLTTANTASTVAELDSDQGSEPGTSFS
jgi:hypothetical protein